MPALLEQMDAPLSIRAISTMLLPTTQSSDSIKKKGKRSDESSLNKAQDLSRYTTSNTSVSTNSASSSSTRIQRKSTSSSLATSQDITNVLVVTTDTSCPLPEIFEQDIMLLDTRCSHHMANYQSFVRDFNENYTVIPWIGTVVIGNGSTAIISGYGYKWLFGRVLIVPAIILSVGIRFVGIYVRFEG